MLADPWARELFVDWRATARQVAAHLRHLNGLHPHDRVLAALVAELCSTSAELRRLWARPEVVRCGRSVHVLRHPVAGDLAVTQQTLAAVGDGARSVVVSTAEDPSHAQALLALAPTG